MLSKYIPSFILVCILLVLIKFDYPKNPGNSVISSHFSKNKDITKPYSLSPIAIDKSVTIETYFQFIDSIVQKYAALTSYNLTEHLLVRANPWIIENLKNTDYYIIEIDRLIEGKEKDLLVI